MLLFCPRVFYWLSLVFIHVLKVLSSLLKLNSLQGGSWKHSHFSDKNTSWTENCTENYVCNILIWVKCPIYKFHHRNTKSVLIPTNSGTMGRWRSLYTPSKLAIRHFPWNWICWGHHKLPWEMKWHSYQSICGGGAA